MNSYLKYKENNRFEAKKSKDKLPSSIWETYSAFANTDGGIILLGVSEDKNNNLYVTGINNVSKVLNELWNGLNNKEKTNLNILNNSDVKIIKENDLNYIEINVPRASNENKPIYLKNNFKNSYKRNHAGDYKCTDEEIKAMIRDQVNDHDSKVLEDFQIEDLNKESIVGYRNIFSQLKEGHVWNKLSDIDFLERIKAIKTVDDVPKPTIAGLLFFGHDYKITYLYPLYFLDYQEKLTDEPKVRYTHRIYTGTGDWSGNIFDFYFRVVGRLMLDIELPFKLQDNSLHRISETSMHGAVREALANCLVNADFNFTRGLVIKKTYTELIFENPGSLRVSVEQAFKGGISDPRNSTLLHMFNQINVGEKAGSGIPKISEAFKETNLKEPILYDEFNPNRTFLRLSFLKVKEVDIQAKTNIEAMVEDYMFSNQEYEIFKHLLEHKEITRKQVEKMLDIGQSRANLLLKGLADNKIIKKVGDSKATKYVIN